MNTTENNILIAKFMGLTIITDNISYFDTDYKPLKKYDTNWNELMQVVERINLLDDYSYSVTILTMDCHIENSKGVKIIDINCINTVDTLINSVYLAVVEFINWYNQQKQL